MIDGNQQMNGSGVRSQRGTQTRAVDADPHERFVVSAQHHRYSPPPRPFGLLLIRWHGGLRWNFKNLISLLATLFRLASTQ